MNQRMYQKKKTPYGVFFFLLLIMMIAAYLLSGVFKIPGASLENWEECLLYVCCHPLSNGNEKTPICLGIAFIAWLMLVNYILYYYRNFQTAIEHGSEEWMEPEKACRELADKEEKYNRILTQNLKVSLRGGLSNNNALVVGSSGVFKTTSLMHQNLLQFGSCYVMLDVKGDTQRKLGKAMEQEGYTVKSLNLKIPEKSDRYNPFVYIEREDDLLRVVKALHDASRPNKQASMADPFWDDGVRLYLQALFYYVWLDARESGRVGTMNDVVFLCNQENIKTIDPDTEEEVSQLQKMMDAKAQQYGNDYPPVRDYRKLKEGAPDTVRSITIMVNAMLTICETGEVKRIFSGNDINIRELGTGVGGDPEKKVVLFLIIPDNNSVYNFIISMFYTQMFDILIRLSDDELKAPLPVPVEVWMDEFYAGAKPADPDVLLGVIRSRNISMIPILQSISQIKTLFKDDKWETIMDNVATVVFLGSGPLAAPTHKYISEALGTATIDSRSDNVHLGHNGNSGLNFQRAKRELMTPDEVKRMPSTETIVFLESRSPIYDTKAIPFDKPELGFVADKYLKKRYSDALSLGEYEHPVYTIYDPKHFSYITVEREKKLQILTDQKEIQTYQEAAKTDPNIYVYDIEEKDLLYLSWGHPERTREEVEKIFQDAMEEEKKRIEEIKGLVVLQDVEDSSVPNFGTQNLETDKSTWNKESSLKELLIGHWEELSAQEQEQIYLGLDEGLTEEQLQHLLLVSLEEMSVLRRAYVLKNSGGIK